MGNFEVRYNIGIKYLQDMINKIKGKTFVTNVYMTMDLVERLLKEPNTKVFTSSDLILILSVEADFNRLYYYARSLKYINIVDCMSGITKSIVCDIIGREEHCFPVVNEFINIGFFHHYTFIRMSTSNPLLGYSLDTSGVEFADCKDEIEINKMLMSEFNVVYAHFPNQNEILVAIYNKDIFVYRDKGKIVGFSYFDKTGKTLCLKYLVVSKKYRGKGLSTKLLIFGFRKYEDIMRYMLWVGSYNEAQNLYKKIGFAEDGLVDEILVYDAVESIDTESVT